jgi:serine/threonine protein kinase
MAVSKRKGERPLESVTDFLNDHYTIDEEFRSGGTGVVFKAHKTADPDMIVAIKFYVIPAQASFLSETTFRALILPEDEEVFATEFNFLKRTRHPGIQELISYGVLDDAKTYFGDRKEIVLPQNGKVRYLISRFIEGSRLSEWLIELVASVGGKGNRTRITARDARRQVCRVLHDIADTLAYIHDVRHYQHSDLRSDNILVHQASGRPIIIDFGYAHCFDAALRKTHTQIRYIADTMPTQLRDDIRRLVADTGSNKVSRESLRQLVFPGLDLHNFGALLNDLLAIKGVDSVLTDFDRQFIRLITRRLVTWKTAREARATDIAGQLKKLESGLRAPAHATSPDVEKHVALPTGGLNLTVTMERLLATRAFRRLQLLNQLSLVHLIYPGASQTRFEHSLAVYVTATQLIDALGRSPRFRLLFDDNGLTRLLTVALLHDINHFPFLHYFQEINDPSLKKIDILDLFCDGRETKDNPSIYEILEGEGISRAYLRSALFEDYDTISDPQLQVIKSIIDSGVDVDKLAYVRDDARFTGVPFGLGVDRDALFEHADIAQLKDEDGTHKRYSYHLCFKPAALSAVESLLLARFWNFR